MKANLQYKVVQHSVKVGTTECPIEVQAQDRGIPSKVNDLGGHLALKIDERNGAAPIQI